LFELEKRIDITQYDNYQKRVFGFIAERLFNVWLAHHQLKFCEIPVVNLEGENLLKKAINLLKRKFLR
jgi:exopolysaccharide biosynthesis protein